MELAWLKTIPTLVFVQILYVSSAFGGDQPYAFVDVAASAGMDFHMPPNAYPRAVAVADYDGDGLSDIFVAVSGRVPNGHPGSPHVGSPSFLFRNCGNGTFEDVTVEAGVYRTNRSSSGAAFADFDNDGDLDLYVANRGALNSPVSINELYRNNGDGIFSEIAQEAGVDNHGFSYSVFWLDFDHDGDLDLYNENLTTCCNEGNTTLDALYRNNGDGTFADITKNIGLLDVAALGGDGGAVADYDDDGFQDILKIAVDAPYSAYYLLHNDGGIAFMDLSDGSGLGRVFDSRGLAFGDYDNDGDFDLFVVGRGLFRNNGDSPRTFTDVTPDIGFDFTPYTGRRFGHTWADLNNDGWLDIVAENRNATLAIFMNMDGSGQFQVFENIEPVLDEAPDPKVGLGVLDFDEDGDLDIFLAKEGDTFHGGQAQVLYENRFPTTNHYLDITLQGLGVTTPRSGNGARIFVEAGGLWQMREVHAGENASGAADYRQHFGLGPHAVADQVTVRWPTGVEVTYGAIPVDQHVRIVEGESNWFPVMPIGIPEFQVDGDVDGSDFAAFESCYSGPEIRTTRCRCTVADLEPDGVIDLQDVGVIQRLFTGP